MTDYLQLAQEAFTTSTTYFDSSIRRPVEAAIRQFQGVHPAGSKYHSDTYRARSRVFRPKTRTTIRKNEAVAAEALFSNKDVVSITAEDDSNEMQQAGSEVMSYLMEFRLKKSIPWFMISMGAYQDAQTVGVCLSFQNWVYDPKKKIDKPVIQLLPIENLRLDPGADWTDPINTSPYLIWLIPMYVKDVRARMTNVDAKTGQPKWKTLTDSQILAAMNSTSDSTRLTRERGRTDSKEQSQSIKDFAIVWVHQNIIEIDGVDMVFHTLGTIDMLSEPVPIGDMYFHGKRPFVMGCCILETHKTYPEGIPGITKDTQAEINEIANQRSDNVKFALNKRYFVARNKQVDIRSLTRNVPSSVTMMENPEKDVIVQNTPDVTSSSYQEQDRLNLDFDDVAGSFSQSSVQSNRNLNETVGGMNLLTTNANQVGTYQLLTFVETWVEPVLRQLMLLEKYYETDEVVLALAGKKAQLLQKMPTQPSMDDLLMQELSLNVNIGRTSTNPQEQINMFMLAMNNLRNLLADGLLEKYGLKVEEVIKEMFGKLGYRDGGRFFNAENEDPALTAAKATIAELEQQLSQKTSPEMVAKQMEKLDAEIIALGAKAKETMAAVVEKNMKSFFASGQAAQMIATMPQLAPVMDGLVMDAGYTAPNPAGIDPNLPVVAEPVPGLVQNPVKNQRTGIEFTPGVSTDPLSPALPASPDVGANQGIETIRSDS